VAWLAADPGVRAAPGATRRMLADAERRLGVRLPRSLRRLYRASNGIEDVGGRWDVVWPLDDVVRRNLDGWEGEAGHPRELLAFGDNGAGDPFCLPLRGPELVVWWYAVGAEATEYGLPLWRFWLGWRSGEVTT
jgi:hypothetical protein